MTLYPKFRLFAARLLATVLVFISSTAHAGPYADPGDEMLRHDLELLADRGLINIPITSWPMMWADINAAILAVDDEFLGDITSAMVVHRVRRRVLEETRVNEIKSSYRVSVADNPRRIRVFENTPRSSVELESELSFTGERFAARLRTALAGNAQDDRSLRLDGSYIAGIFGNTAISVGWQDKWWGPGWAGTLGLSTNARPVPGVLLQRNFSRAFSQPILNWLGPWSYQVTLGRKESNRAVPNPYLFGMRLNFKPTRSLELGLSRTAQWGGEGRVETFDSFVNMLLGRDNEGSDGLNDSSEPGNQLAGFDARWTIKRGRWPIAVYGQIMGEDEAGGFPSKYLGQFGVSSSMPWGIAGSYISLRAEYSDTTCQFNENSKIFNCAYNNSQFPVGYRYRGQAIGHSTDNDTSQLALNWQLATVEERRYSAILRIAKINRGGLEDFAHSLTSLPRNLANIEFSHERPLYSGKIVLGLGYDVTEDTLSGDEKRSGRVFLQWSRDAL